MSDKATEPRDLTEQQFVARLIAAGWSEEDAKREAYEQLYGDAGDCDGDLYL